MNQPLPTKRYKPWKKADVFKLKRLSGTQSVKQIATELGRTVSAVQQKTYEVRQGEARKAIKPTGGQFAYI